MPFLEAWSRNKGLIDLRGHFALRGHTSHSRNTGRHARRDAHRRWWRGPARNRKRYHRGNSLLEGTWHFQCVLGRTHKLAPFPRLAVNRLSPASTAPSKYPLGFGIGNQARGVYELLGTRTGRVPFQVSDNGSPLTEPRHPAVALLESGPDSLKTSVEAV